MPNVYLSEGFVFHARPDPGKNVFRYPVFTLMFSLSEEAPLQQLLAKKFKGLLSLRSQDYLGGASQSFHRCAVDFLREKCGYEAEEIWLQSFPRMLGYVFNPVSFWFCKKQGRLDAVLCEVNNTFGERHFYWIHTGKALEESDWFEAKKIFHVSPFLPIEGFYRFKFALQENRCRVDISLFSDDQKLRLATWVEGRWTELSQVSPLQIFLKYGWMTPLVVLRIHWQAFLLWRKKHQFYSKPNLPNDEVSS